MTTRQSSIGLLRPVAIAALLGLSVAACGNKANDAAANNTTAVENTTAAPAFDANTAAPLDNSVTGNATSGDLGNTGGAVGADATAGGGAGGTTGAAGTSGGATSGAAGTSGGAQ